MSNVPAGDYGRPGFYMPFDNIISRRSLLRITGFDIL